MKTPLGTTVVDLRAQAIYIFILSFVMVALSNRADNYIFILSFVMVAVCNRADHYIFALLFLSAFFPRLISAAV